MAEEMVYGGAVGSDRGSVGRPLVVGELDVAKDSGVVLVGGGADAETCG